MKINDELERLLGTEAFRQQTRTVGNSGGEGFESLLTQQLAATGEASPDEARMLRALGDPLRLANLDVMNLGGLAGVDGTPDAASDEALIEALSGGISSTLNGLDKYAAGLRDASPAGLRDAWTALESLDGAIAGLRQDMGRLSKPDAEMESMLTELEVLATTEKFKFNRGDYLAE